MRQAISKWVAGTLCLLWMTVPQAGDDAGFETVERWRFDALVAAGNDSSAPPAFERARTTLRRPQGESTADLIDASRGASADMLLTVSPTDSFIGVGDSLSFTATVENLGVNDATPELTVDFSALQAGIELTDTVGPAWSCGSPVNGVLVCTSLTILPVMSSQSLDFTFVGNDTLALSCMSLEVTVTDGFDPNLGNNNDTHCVEVAGSGSLSDLQLVASSPISEIPPPGGQVPINVEIGNLGPDASFYNQFELDFDPSTFEFIFASAPADFGCIEAMPGSVTCNRQATPPFLSPGMSDEFILQFEGAARQLGTARGTPSCIDLTVISDPGFIDPNPSNNLGQVCFSPQGGSADVAITSLASDPPIVSEGSNFIAEVQVINNGLDVADLSKVTLDFSSTIFEFNPGGSGNVSCISLAPSLVECDLSAISLQDQEAATFRIPFTNLSAPDQRGLPQNCLFTTVSTITNDPDLLNNEGSLCVSIQGNPVIDLGIAKTALQAQIEVGEQVTFEVTISSNINSSGGAQRFDFTDTVPAGLEYLSFSSNDPDWTCIDSGDVVCSWIDVDNPLQPGAQTIVSLVFQGVAEGTQQNLVEITNCDTAKLGCGDPNPNNDIATADVDVLAGSPFVDLSISKVALTPVVVIGDTASFEITVRNELVSSAGAVSMSFDDFPALGLDFAGFTGADWNCAPFAPDQRGSFLRCDYSGSLLLSPGGETSVTLDFGTSQVGQLTNEANIVDCVQSGLAPCNDANSANDQGSDSVTVEPQGGGLVAIEKTASANSVPINTSFSYLLRVSNNSQSFITDATVVDSLPAGVLFVSADSNDFTCIESSPSVINCSSNMGFSLAPGGNSLIELNVEAPAQPGEIINTAQVIAFGGKETDSDQVAVTVFDDQTVDLTISAGSFPESVTVGEAYSYGVRITNDGGAAATGVLVTAVLAEGVVLEQASGNDFSCTSSGQTVTCVLAGQLPGASARDLIFDVLAPEEAGVIQLLVSVDGNEPDTNPSNNNSSANTTVLADEGGTQPLIDLALQLAVDPATISIGGQSSVQALISNAGPESATDVSLQLQLPSTVQAATISDANWICEPASSGLISCQSAAVIMAGESSTLSFEVTGVQAGSSLISGMVSASQSEPTTANNSDQVSIEVIEATGRAVDLALGASATPATVAEGDLLVYTLLINNLGDGPAGGVFVDLNLGSAFGFEAHGGAGWNCTVSATPRCTLGSVLEAGAQSSLEVTAVTNDAQGSGLSTFEVGFVGLDINLANNSAQVTTQLIVATGADLVLQKSASVSTVAGLESFSYQLEVLNQGPQAAQGVVITDPLPAGLEFESATGAGWNCTSSGSTVTCLLGTDLVVGAQSSVTLQVKAPRGPATVVNVASVSASSEDPVPGNNTSEVTVEVGRPSQERISDLLEETAGSDPVAGPLASPLAGLCARGAADVREICDEIITAADDGRDGEVRGALRGMAPDELSSQASSMMEISRAQFFNVDARLNELRGGGGGFSSAGLAMRFGDQMLPFSVFSITSQANDDSEGGYADGLVSPWGFFINGTLSTGDRNDTRQELGFDFDTYGLTAGVDYRFSPSRVVGLAIGYARFDSDYLNDSQLRTRGMTVTGYGSFYLSDNLYFDVRGSAGRSSFDQDRRIRFTVGDLTVDRLAIGASDANQYTLGTTFGYHLNVDRWNITPSLSARIVRNTIDGFTETGAGSLSMQFDDQTFDSSQLTANLHVSRAFSTDRGVFTPQFDLAWHNETRNSGLEVIGRFADAPDNEIFRLRGENFDSNFGSAGIGVVWVAPNGRQAYINYRNLFSADGMTRRTINLGARFEF